MEKLLELEKKLKEYRDELEKMSSHINESGEELSQSEKDKKDKKKNPDEKEDAELGEEVEGAVERHFKNNKETEKEEGHKLEFKKEEDGEFVKMEEVKFQKNGQWSFESLEKGLGSKLDNAESKERVKHALGSIRQPAKVTDSEGNVSEVSPAKQVSDKASAVSQKKDAAKMKAESEAAARRASFKKQGLMKNNQQWTLE
jgi:hypothetical protein